MLNTSDSTTVEPRRRIFAFWPKSADVGRAEHVCSAPGISDVDLFRYCEGIIYLNAEVSDGAFNLGVAEQELHGP
jgi:hypothetical protein